MGLELRLAWRNVWRNPRRTGLTVAATVFAVVLVVFFVAMAAGVHEKMIEDAVRVNSGHVMLTGKDYLEKRGLEQYVTYGDRLERLLDESPGVLGVAPRVVSFGLLSKVSRRTAQHWSDGPKRPSAPTPPGRSSSSWLTRWARPTRATSSR